MKFFRLEELKSACEISIQEWVDKDNASYVLQVADMYGASILKAFCSNFIMKQGDVVNKNFQQ